MVKIYYPVGKIRVKTLGDEAFEDKQQKDAEKRRQAKALKKGQPAGRQGKEHVKGVGLKGGQQVAVMEGVELKPEVEALLQGEGEEVKKKSVKKKKLRVRSKRYTSLSEKIDKTKFYPLKEALKLLKDTSTVKFDASVDVHININPATLPKDKVSLSGSVNLPHGTGKKRVIKIVDDALLETIAKGKIDFDVLVAHPSFMPKLAKHAKVLGPKGLMPNPKNGTVTPDPEKRAKELSGGELAWKTEPNNPVIHQTLGKISFGEEKLADNIKAFAHSVNPSKIAKFTLTSSMGPGIKVDLSSL